MIKSLSSKFYIFPFLFSLYPVLALIATNSAEMDLLDGLRTLIGSFIFVLVINGFVLVITKSRINSALITSLFLLLFYSYGHINIISRTWTIFEISFGRHRTLLPLYGFIFILGTWWILRTKRDLSKSVQFLNAFSIILIIFPIYQITAYQIGEYQARQQRGLTSSETSIHWVGGSEMPPDVYYIVVDGYPRGDFISQNLGSSNTEFLDSLEERGFFVAHCSMSNYSDTRFSLASTLNMTYLDGGQNIPEVVFPGSTLDSMIRSGSVQKNFKVSGYTIVTFESGYKWLRWEDADLHLDPTQEQTTLFLQGGLSSFEQLFLDTTAAKLILDVPFLIDRAQLETLANFVDNPRAAHRERVMFALDQVAMMPGIVPGPKFVYAHIIFPHPPFVVDAAGNSIQNTPANEVAAYVDQITYINRRLLEIVEELIANSEVEPIIIIQGDHGATLDYQDLNIDEANRLGILNTYYLPEILNGGSNGSEQEVLYPSITPVNTFRVIFDQYYGGNYGLLEDKSIVGRQSPYVNLDCTHPE